MQQTRDSPEFRLIFQVTLNHRLLSAEAGAACRRVPRPASSTRWAASTGSSTTSPRSLPSRSGGSDATIVHRVRELIARPRRNLCVFGCRSLWKSRSVIKKISRARLTLSAARGIYGGQRSCSFELRDRAA
jgi:hypothetical protein